MMKRGVPKAGEARDPATWGAPSRPVLLAWALLAASSACSTGSERMSNVATTTQSGVWERAYVKVEYHPSFFKNGRTNAAFVSHTMTIEGDHDRGHLSVFLGTWYEGGTPKSLFQEMRDTPYDVEFAPDGHAIAVSTDHKKTFTIFDLTPSETGTAPFYCPHVHFDKLAPWPDVRRLVLEVLDESSGAASTHHHDASVTTKAPIKDNDGELLGAALYACKLEQSDAELHRALIDAYVSSWHGARESRGGDDLAKCMGAVALRDPATMEKLRAASTLADRAIAFRARGALYDAEESHAPAPAPSASAPSASASPAPSASATPREPAPSMGH